MAGNNTNPNPPSVQQILNTRGLGKSMDEVDKILSTTGIGSINTAMGNTYYGINHRHTPGSMQLKKDYYGYTFFTRPRFNFTEANLSMVRSMIKLATIQKQSIQAVIRAYLDPELPVTDRFSCDLIDNRMAFIPVLTNNLISISGWPDVRAPIHQYQDGPYKETMSVVDGISDIYSTYDITANFRNMPGNPIVLLFLYWIRAMTYQFEGRMIPYIDDIVKKQLNYTTRIYRLVMDETKTYVRAIASCGAAFPISAPLGGMFDFESDHPVNSNTDQVSINFNVTGAMYEDDINIWAFNKTVAMFNPSMADRTRSTAMMKIPFDALALYNYRGYPWINDKTQQLEWWVSQDAWNSGLALYHRIHTDSLEQVNTFKIK